MNETGRPPERPADTVTAPQTTDTGGRRAWRREVGRLNDDELMRVVRGIASVYRAVAGYRKRAA